MMKITDKDDLFILRYYASLEGSELGEYGNLLCDLCRYSYCMSPAFRMALRNAIKTEIRNYKENSKIIEETETVTRTNKYLEWSN